ncbi:restriction endonuclease subunit S [Clostridium perfringens]|nr:restriction endonuclease subunit S [Clostridium perfringens]
MKRIQKIKEVCTISGGYAFKSNDFTRQGIPIIRIGDISGNKVNISSGTVFFEEYNEKLNKFIIEKGDILVALSGATTGKFGIYDEEIQALLNQRVAKISPKENINNKYLYYYMNKLQNIIYNKALGCAQPNISPNEIGEIEIYVPSRLEQDKISDVLDIAKDLIDKRKKQIEELDLLVKSKFIEMFGNPVSNPKGWEKVALIDLGELARGKSKHRPRNAPELMNGPYPLIQTGDVANAGIYIKEYTQTYSELGLQQSKMWKAGTLCITIAANIAKTTILTFDACFPDSIVAFIPNEKTNTMFIQFWMSFLQKILEDSAPESAQKNINLKILGEQRVIVPPIEFQNQFADFVKQVDKLKFEMEKSLKELEDNFNSLMQKSFKGKLFI